METRCALAGACPTVLFSYPVRVLGLDATSDAESLDFGNMIVTDEQIEELAENLALMPCLREVDMYESDLSVASCDLLFDAFPDIFFGWTITMESYVVRTDVTAFSTLKSSSPPYYTDEQLHWVRYCKKLLALDLGHNQITDISFLRNFPHLKVLILADNRITDISPLSDLMELEYVELFLNRIADWSPLANHEALLDLNLYHNIAPSREPPINAEAIATCPNLERCWLAENILTSAQVNAMTTGLPGCIFNFTSYGATDDGWREHPRYEVIKTMMSAREYIPFGEK
jgi:Leucine-rich repeat (LRR) protein